MITTVTLNPAIDKIIEIKAMALGKVHRIEKQTLSLGGKSINVARLLSGYELDTSALCFLGKKNIDQVQDMAQKDGIPLNSILLEGLTRTNLKLVEADMGYRTTDLNEAGFTVSKDKLDQMMTLIKKEASKADCMVFSGSLPKGVGQDFYKIVCEELSGLTKVVIDADGQALKLAMEGAPFLIKPNKHELEAATGIVINTEEDIIKVSKTLIQQYGITYILVSRGEDGSVLVGKDLVLSAGILPVNLVSTVGAGDSMLAGLILGLISSDEGFGNPSIDVLKKALKYGVASSCIAISSQERKAINLDELKSLAENVEIKRVNIIK